MSIKVIGINPDCLSVIKSENAYVFDISWNQGFSFGVTLGVGVHDRMCISVSEKKILNDIELVNVQQIRDWDALVSWKEICLFRWTGIPILDIYHNGQSLDASTFYTKLDMPFQVYVGNHRFAIEIGDARRSAIILQSGRVFFSVGSQYDLELIEFQDLTPLEFETAKQNWDDKGRGVGVTVDNIPRRE